MPFHVLEHHSESQLWEGVTTMCCCCRVHSNQEPAAHALSWQPFSPSICKLCAAPLPLDPLQDAIHDLWLFVHIQISICSSQWENMSSPWLEKSLCYFAGGLERRDYALRFKTNSFQIIFMYMTYLACDSSAWNTKKPHAISFGATFLVSKLLLKMDQMDCQ